MNRKLTIKSVTIRRSFIFLFVVMLIVMFFISSCKTIQTSASTSLRQGQTLSPYTILIGFQDNGGTINQVFENVNRLVSPINVQVMNSSSFYDNTKEMQVSTEAISEYRINTARSELYKIAGVMTVNVYKN